MNNVNDEEIKKLCDLEDKHWWYSERRSIIKAFIKRYGVLGSSLDLGACGGGNTRVLISCGIEATALEFASSGIEICKQRGVPFMKGDAREIHLPSESKDLVMALDILEHIDEDYLVIGEIFRVLKKGGLVLISVPTGMDLWSSHDVAVNHIRRYERGELLSLIHQHDFDILEHYSWNIILRGLVKARRKISKGNDLEKLNSVLNCFLSILIRLERPIKTLRIRGVSEFMVARKR